MNDVRDAVIEMFADSEAALLETLAITSAALDAYQLVAYAGARHCHELHVRLEALQRRYDSLLNEYRALRQQVRTAA